MKVVLLVIGSLAALYTLFGVIQLIGVLTRGIPGSAYGAGNLAGSVLAPVLGLIVALACFQRAFRDR